MVHVCLFRNLAQRTFFSELTTVKTDTLLMFAFGRSIIASQKKEVKSKTEVSSSEKELN